MVIMGNVHGQVVEIILDALNVVNVLLLERSRMEHTNSDLISREALLKVIRDDRLTNASDAIYFITNAPAVSGEAVAWMLPNNEGNDSFFRDNASKVMCKGNDWSNWIPLYLSPQQPQSVEEALEKAVKLLESQRFMALDSTKTYTSEEYRQGLKSSVAFLAKQIRKLIPVMQPIKPKEGE